MIQGRRKLLQLPEVMRKHFPGCRNARLRAVAPLRGVRETRRIVGDFRFAVQNVVERSAVSAPHRLHRLRVGPAGSGQTQLSADDGSAHQAHRDHPDPLPHPATASGAQSYLPGPGGERGRTRRRCGCPPTRATTCC